MRAPIARYRAAVDATIEAVETRRTAAERLVSTATEIRTIVSATVQLLDRETNPAILTAGARLAETFGETDAAGSRLLATRTPAEANAANAALLTLRHAIESLADAAGANRRIQRFLKAMSEPVDHLAEALRQVVAADERLRTASLERDAAGALVLNATADQRTHAMQSQQSAIATMLTEVEHGISLRPAHRGNRNRRRHPPCFADRTQYCTTDRTPYGCHARACRRTIGYCRSEYGTP